MSWFGGQRGWPDERERWLLRAASFPDQRGHEAWRQWRAGFDPERLTLQDQRLLAAAFRSLRAAGADGATDPAFALAARLYRRTWYLNNLAVRRAGDDRRSARGRADPGDRFQGLALARLHYDDLGARPMQDVDLLVHPEDATAAVTALRGLGYEVLASEGPGLGPLKYGTHLTDADGNEVDVHFYSLIESADDSDLWEQPVNLALGRTTALALAPAEQLLHVCAHGMRHSAETPIGWIADAMAILGSSQDTLDWDRLVALTVQRRLSASVGAALTWLREEMPAPVPDWVIRDLRSGTEAPARDGHPETRDHALDAASLRALQLGSLPPLCPRGSPRAVRGRLQPVSDAVLAARGPRSAHDPRDAQAAPPPTGRCLRAR